MLHRVVVHGRSGHIDSCPYPTRIAAKSGCSVFNFKRSRYSLDPAGPICGVSQMNLLATAKITPALAS